MSTIILKKINYFKFNVRYLGFRARGKPPGVAKTIQERIKILNYKDPSIHYKVDIGYAESKIPKGKILKERLKVLKENRSNQELEKLSRNKKLLLNLDEISKQWFETKGPEHIKQIAEYYGVFEHLYGDAYFLPRKFLSINYLNDNEKIPVKYGNLIKPRLAKNKPEVFYESKDSSLWTLIMTNPDGNLYNPESECVHWFLTNIPGNKIEKGETIFEYLQPFPPRGVGYQRLIFVLYKQEKPLNLSDLKKTGKNLQERTFKTLDFYRTHEDLITPAGLLFYQSDYDSTLKDFFHKELDMLEPIYEYDFPAEYHPEQKWFPLKQPFNLYMDRYRDPRKINQEYLVKQLKKTHPFNGPEPELPYPNADYLDKDIPSWLKTKIRNDRIGWGRINEYKY